MTRVNINIKHLTHDKVDKVKWDACLERAANGLIYSSSYYLDRMSKHWDALVLNDYEAIMPLTWNRKYGFFYLYQPPFTACLGIFGNELDAGLLIAFLNAIPSHFRYWDIYLNPDNYFNQAAYPLYERVNYFLPLHDSYESLYGRFRENTQRNIKKSVQAGCIVKKDIPVKEVIHLSNKQLGTFSKRVEENFENIAELYYYLHERKKAITYGVYNPTGKLAASAVFFFDHKRAYYILVGNHRDGKATGASHALLNAFIKDHASQPLILDFEGSDIPGLASYYSSFGSTVEKYPGLKLNRLPAPFRWLKK